MFLVSECLRREMGSKTKNGEAKELTSVLWDLQGVESDS